jgi:hypothetical protein
MPTTQVQGLEFWVPSAARVEVESLFFTHKFLGKVLVCGRIVEEVTRLHPQLLIFVEFSDKNTEKHACIDDPKSKGRQTCQFYFTTWGLFRVSFSHRRLHLGIPWITRHVTSSARRPEVSKVQVIDRWCFLSRMSFGWDTKGYPGFCGCNQEKARIVVFRWVELEMSSWSTH